MDLDDEKRSPSMEAGLRGAEPVEAVDFLRLPKVLLHEHLDGGLRAQTVLELARGAGYGGLPTEDGRLEDHPFPAYYGRVSASL